MLRQVLAKIEAGELEFSDKELKVAAAYAPTLLMQKPALLKSLAAAVPEGLRAETVRYWVAKLSVANRFEDSSPISPDDYWSLLASCDEVFSDLAEKKAHQLIKNNQGEGDFDELYTAQHQAMRMAALQTGGGAVKHYIYTQSDADLMRNFLDFLNEIGGEELQKKSIQGQMLYPPNLGVQRDAEAVRVIFERAGEIGGKDFQRKLLEKYDYQAFREGFRSKDKAIKSLLMSWAKELGGEAYQKEILQYRDYALFVDICASGDIESVGQLMALAEELGGKQMQWEMLFPGNDGGCKAFSAAVLRPHTMHVAQQLLTWIGELEDELKGELRGKAVVKSQTVKEVLSDSVSMAFENAFRTNSLSYAQNIMALAGEIGGRRLQRELMGGHSFKLLGRACTGGNIELARQFMAWAKEFGGVERQWKALAPAGDSDGGLFSMTYAQGHADIAEQLLTWAKELADEMGDEAMVDAKTLQKNMIHAMETRGEFAKAWLKSSFAGIQRLMALSEEFGGVELQRKMLDGLLSPTVFIRVDNTFSPEEKDQIKEWVGELGTEWMQVKMQRLLNASSEDQALWEEHSKQGLQAWHDVYNHDPPHPDLLDLSPFRFSGKIYDQILPVMEAASRVEQNARAEYGAYIMAVLFSSAQEAERYLDRYASEWCPLGNQQVVHDATGFQLPSDGEWNPKRWKDMVLKYGPAATKYLGLADKIEAHIKENGIDFPQTPKEIQSLASLVAYERSAENPQFAELALSFGLPESDFNQGLEIIKTRSKTEDHVPDITIDGADIGHPNYYMEKLPPGDVRGLMLGELTNCCQHIGDAGAPCAIHGFSSKEAGFYVWKQKTKGKMTAEDTIVAQSWVWRGEDNALVFDSFERLGSEYDGLAQPFLEQFAHEVQGKHFSQVDEVISAVRVGTGGYTPRGLWGKCDTPSKPLDYDDYRDSDKQYDVPPRQHRKQTDRELTPEEVPGPWLAQMQRRAAGNQEQGPAVPGA